MQNPPPLLVDTAFSESPHHSFGLIQSGHDNLSTVYVSHDASVELLLFDVATTLELKIKQHARQLFEQDSYAMAARCLDLVDRLNQKSFDTKGTYYNSLLCAHHCSP